MSKENDRFWILASHPTIPLFVAGKDSELIVFKLIDTKIPSANCLNNILFYFNNTIKIWKEGITEKKMYVKFLLEVNQLNMELLLF